MLDFGKKEEEKKPRCLAAQPHVAACDVSVGDIAEINMIFFTPTSTLLIDLNLSLSKLFCQFFLNKIKKQQHILLQDCWESLCN